MSLVLLSTVTYENEQINSNNASDHCLVGRGRELRTVPETNILPRYQSQEMKIMINLSKTNITS